MCGVAWRVRSLRWNPTRQVGTVVLRGAREWLHPGRTHQLGGGTDLTATLINCFVQPVGDSVSEVIDGKPGIYMALLERRKPCAVAAVSATILFNPPRGACTRHAGIQRTCRTCVCFDPVAKRWSRGFARVEDGILRCDHPDIEEFIHAKDRANAQFQQQLRGSDTFMRAMEARRGLELASGTAGQEITARTESQAADGRWIYRTVKARDLWIEEKS